MTLKYRESHKETDPLPLSETFNRAELDELLAQPGCAGIRIYYGKSDDGLLHAVLIGVDKNDNDLLENGQILEDSRRCPPVCATPPSALNS